MKTFRFILGVLAFLAFTTHSNAQPGNASVSNDGAVVINTQESLKSEYILDASNFGFTSENDAINYFKDKNSKYVSYRPVLQNDVIMVYLQIKAQPEWTKADWNAYLAENKIRAKILESSEQITKE